MESAAPLTFGIANAVFLLTLLASIGFGVLFSSWWFRSNVRRTIALTSLSLYCAGCALILLFALSTTSIGL